MPSVKNDVCAKAHAQEGLWHALRSAVWVSASVCRSVSEQELKVGGKERNPGIFMHAEAALENTFCCVSELYMAKIENKMLLKAVSFTFPLLG